LLLLPRLLRIWRRLWIRRRLRPRRLPDARWSSHDLDVFAHVQHVRDVTVVLLKIAK
jgi:hypothetical protein